MSSSKSLIIIPCFNEAKRLPVEEYNSFFEDNSSISFLFIDDGSTDKTLEILHNFKHNHSTVEVLSLNKNQGKAEAIRKGVLQVNEVDFDYIGYIDADLATPLNEIYRLLNQANNEPKVGKTVALQAEKELLATVTDFGGYTMKNVAVKGNRSYYEAVMEFTTNDGVKHRFEQVNRTKWKKGLITNERYFHA